ncbi:regulator of G-protein signaling loco isoform X3 [Drosophila persimilis]|uniref:regulator of G-protein signaling loco isoform X3 n=1 Tax=Drosophila persimilis TaxID=7234 RepID=UPI000F074CAE|nr:regulator of G-protein signaling loco isoform X3 [Drosophila persimilis]XP_026842845.1 regulator of G-protein signaling loco isoform X3 [Drosophila persimilis]
MNNRNINSTKIPIIKSNKSKSTTDTSAGESIASMVERFVQSLSQLNDSGTFDSSFEIKRIQQTPKGHQHQQHHRHRCLTELDRENLTRFVREFEERQASSTPKAKSKPAKSSSPFICRKAREIYHSASGRRSASPQINIREPQEEHQLKQKEEEEQQILATRKYAGAEDLMPPPMALARVQAERRSCRSAARVLQFFSSAAKRRSCSRKLSEPEADSRASSPVLLRVSPSHQAEQEQEQDQERMLGCVPLSTATATGATGSEGEEEDDEEHDDGISSASSNITSQSGGSNSRNISPDSSFEMHAPLLPSFKVTPPRAVCKAGKSAAYEFARFLRGSFHAKRASVTTGLRRSLSDPDAVQQMDFSKPPVLGDATNVIRNRALPANASPFRRAWGQSSFRTPRSDKGAKQLQPHQQQQQQSSSPLVRRTASMNASDNDMYIKTLMLDDLKTSTRSQQQLSLLQVPKILTTPAPPSAISVSAETAAAADNLPDNGSPSSWGGSFERMLQDAAGMQTFSEFLKKEFSAENIYFWTACERYRLLESEAERAIQARDIFGKHLANSSSDPVNVDSQARSLTEEKLASAAPDIFAPAQKQIFNLMKFDSYQRFIRSDLYKSCVEAEQKNLPLPYSGADLDELLKTNFHLAASSKLKKSVSNAEDRRRKSLLPWHRKTRSKSRDRTEIMSDLQSSSLMPAPPLPPPTLLSSASLKIASGQNSLSDLHSSRSSLSSFDAGASGGHGASAESVCSLCRVILTDGATTIVQTRPGETVGQLVERLLEKRNLVYPYYDIVFQGSTKSIDLQQSSQLLAGKEVVIERRVAFKLDLPDPKVISVKSKPKKQLHEVIRPILTKYNYKMDNVQVIMRDTQAPLDLMQPVTMADGQRLRIVLLQSDFQCGGGSNMPPKQTKPMKPLPPTAQAHAQGQLDELTNKMFNELLQSKAEAAASDRSKPQPSDLCSMKSNEAPSESSSSLFERMRRQQQRDNIPGSKLPKLKKKSTSSQHSEETTANPSSSSSLVAAAAAADPKKPIIAKLKAGVKLQVTERVAEHQDELLEGLKRAQLARLEDQRGTEINFDLPDFLKNKENLNAAVSKLRKVRANLSPVTSKVPPSPTEIPQPAPRLSITRSQQQVSPMKVDQEQETELPVDTQDQIEFAKAPPPLPPKPKVLPIKPSNWGVAVPQTAGIYCNKYSPTKQVPTSPTTKVAVVSAAAFVSKIPLDIGRKTLEEAAAGTRCAYLDEPSSSFV